jgi:hypothetical protein
MQRTRRNGLKERPFKPGLYAKAWFGSNPNFSAKTQLQFESGLLEGIATIQTASMAVAQATLAVGAFGWLGLVLAIQHAVSQIDFTQLGIQDLIIDAHSIAHDLPE